MGHRCPAHRHRLPPRSPRPHRQAEPTPANSPRRTTKPRFFSRRTAPGAQPPATPETPPPIANSASIAPASFPEEPCRVRNPRPRRKTSRPSRRRLELLRFQSRKTIPGAETNHPGRTAIPMAENTRRTPAPAEATGTENRNPAEKPASEFGQRFNGPASVFETPYRVRNPRPRRETGPPSRTTFQWLHVQSRNTVWGAGKMSYRGRKTGNPLRVAIKRPRFHPRKTIPGAKLKPNHRTDPTANVHFQAAQRKRAAIAADSL